MDIKLKNRYLGLSHPSYFIADIAANHDGELDRAKLLIRLAAQAGADAAKFQNFQAPRIVSASALVSRAQGSSSPAAGWVVAAGVSVSPAEAVAAGARVPLGVPASSSSSPPQATATSNRPERARKNSAARALRGSLRPFEGLGLSAMRVVLILAS